MLIISAIDILAGSKDCTHVSTLIVTEAANHDVSILQSDTCLSGSESIELNGLIFMHV